MVLRIVYTLFLALFLAVFVGVGIATFYKAPEPPVYSYEKEPTTTEISAERDAYDAYQEAMSVYNRNVSLAALIAAVLLLSLGMLMSAALGVLAEGVVLGGGFTLLYGIGRGLASGEETYRFVVVTVGLILVLFMGYKYFGKGVKK